VSPELSRLISGVQFPRVRDLTLTIVPPPSLGHLLGSAQFPATRDLALAIMPPPALNELVANRQFPAAQDLALTIMPPPSLGELAANAQFPAARDLTLTIEPPLGQAKLFADSQILRRPGTGVASAAALATPSTSAPSAAAPSATPSPADLAAIATASFPTSQSLSATLVPPPSPLIAIASANFPVARSLSVTLVPPATPLAAIAAAKFPASQPLSVTLYPGETLDAATMLSGVVSALVPGSGHYTVQIVQVIPRRGAQFFDYRDPTGAGTVLVAGATTQTVSGGPLGPVCVPPATPPLSADICGTTLSLSDDGFPFGANLGPQGNRSMHLTPVGGAQIQIAAQTGIAPNAACPGLLCMTTQVFTPGAACDNVSFVDTGTPKAPIVKFRRNGGQVCAQRLQ